MKRTFCLLMLSILFAYGADAQVTNSADIDSTYHVFPNPAHERFFVTTQGRVVYAMLITTHGEKHYEYFQNDITSYQNQYGLGCGPAGCAGATIASNFICTLNRGNLDNGLYYLVLLDDLGHVYHTIIIFH
jgi:hypothetical protein